MRYRTRHDVHRFLSAIVACVALSACQSIQPTPASNFPTTQPVPTLGAPPTRTLLVPSTGAPQGNLPLSGQFIFEGPDGNVSLLDVKTGALRILVKNDSRGYAQSPAFSPDAKQVAYSYSLFTTDGQVQSQIRAINVDGSNDRVIVSPTDMRITVDMPMWSPDGKQIYFTQIIPTGESGQRAEIDRVGANGGALTQVIADGLEAHLSPDGKRIVYQRLDFTTYAASLWIANVNGNGGKQLVDGGTFAAISGGRFSPDAQGIVFAASGPPKKKLPGAQGYLLDRSTASESCLFSFLFTCLLEKAEAHGLPWDLWLVNPDGSKFERLTQIGADSPVPVWSADGKSIVFYEAMGIYMLDRETKTIRQISTYGGYGGFDWR